MSKQVLSVADFALILNIVNERIISYEEYACRTYGKRDDLFIHPAMAEFGEIEVEPLRLRFVRGYKE